MEHYKVPPFVNPASQSSLPSLKMSDRLSGMSRSTKIHPNVTPRRSARSMVSLDDRIYALHDEGYQPGVLTASNTSSTVEQPTIPRDIKLKRRGSWLPLPEHPSKTLPKSRTLSNLTRSLNGSSKGSSSSLVSRKSSTTSTVASQVPSNKSLSRIRLPSTSKNILRTPIAKTLSRSDTEPLLPLTDLQRKKSILRSSLVGLKENIDPDKPYQTKSHLSSIPQSSPLYDHNNGATYSTPRSKQPSLDHRSPLTTSRSHLLHALPRSSTQPSLPTRDIKVHSLLTPLSPPTPTPSQTSSLFAPLSPLSSRSPSPDRHRQVEYQPPSYWAGRLSSLHDRVRNRDLLLLFPGSGTREDGNENLELPILAGLYAECATPAALLGFSSFLSRAEGNNERMAASDDLGFAVRCPWAAVEREGRGLGAARGEGVSIGGGWRGKGMNRFKAVGRRREVARGRRRTDRL